MGKKLNALSSNNLIDFRRDVNDLSKLVFQKKIQNIKNENENESKSSMNISAFDMRIYDLEKRY